MDSRDASWQGSVLMMLYLMRHADAMEGADDEARPLSPKGRTQARAMGRFFKRSGIRFTSAFSSPLARARQTAELMLESCQQGAAKLVRDAEELRNEASREQFHRWLSHLPKVDVVLMVGHMPSMSSHLAELLEGKRDGPFDLAKGAIAGIEHRGHGWCLRFFIEPATVSPRHD
jgi:phosphohistidine phosphatase